ncbi:MAG: hypothetical protein OQK94_05215 [Gammaproteobacteria bacterium]|nr:hypothetical protein [Gammaproteobacteria bacterium]MCW8957992.1 hypothetical protein [Gammaproteobacteria bacterium]MCW9088136.1 hypothetical protein [Gammaproteobacteria bacterium]
MRQESALLLLALLTAPAAALADCIQDQYGNVVCGAGECARDQYGKVFCAPVGGGALRDNHGTVKCGIGHCARDRDGEVWCSTVPGGGAALDAYGKVKCYKGCEVGTTERCAPGQ